VKQHTILVTGASSGIGRATALRLAQDGHRVIAAARRIEVLRALADESAGRIVPRQLDVRSDESVQTLAAELRDHAPDGIDALVNAAGYALSGPVEALSVNAVRAQFETNVFGALRVTNAVLPQMRRRGSGRVVNVSSVVGRVALPGMGVYSASKFALEALSDALRMELAGFGVRVVLIEPGFVKTDIATASAQEAAEHPAASGDYAAMQQAVDRFLEQQTAKAPAPETVATAIARAAVAKRPRARYVVPRSGAALIGALNGMPTAMADRGKLSQAKLNNHEVVAA
jgi:NAD(P)-dependent dehydrogenase (short-subunit alcohol dehydrogenase family)